MDRDLNTLAFIQEQVSYPEDNVDFGYSIHEGKNGSFYLKFKAVLQSFGVRNRNNRFYEASNVMQQIETSEYIQTMLQQNSWMGEYDHPAETIAGQKLTMQRIGNPDPKHTCHYIRKPWLEGNLLKAPIQTDSGTEEGRNLASKIVDGGVIPAFSARVLGELQSRNGNPTVMVKRLVTYDSVLFPSHREAIGEIKTPMITEAVEELEKATNVTIIYFPELARMAAMSSEETEWLCESFHLSIDDVVGVTETGNSIVIQEKKNVYVQPITDKVIRAKTINAMHDFMKKRK